MCKLPSYTCVQFPFFKKKLCLISAIIVPFWDETGVHKSGIFSDFGNFFVWLWALALSYRLTEGCTFTFPHVTQRRIFFHIFHSKIPLFCFFNVACEAQPISCLCTKYVEAEEVHSVLPEFSELCRYSPCAGAVCDSCRLLLSQAESGSRSMIRHQPKLEKPWILPSPSAATAEISYCVFLHRRVVQTKIKANLLFTKSDCIISNKKRGCFGFRPLFVSVTSIYYFFSQLMNSCIFFFF